MTVEWRDVCVRCQNVHEMPPDPHAPSEHVCPDRLELLGILRERVIYLSSLSRPLFWRRHADGQVEPLDGVERLIGDYDWVSDENRQIERTCLDNGVEVSTVFLALDHGFGEDPEGPLHDLQPWDDR